MRYNSASSWVTLGDSVGRDACSPRNCSSGERRSRLRSAGSAARKALTSSSDSRALRPCLQMLSSTASCSSSVSVVSACASVGPIAPEATCCSADGVRRVPIALRRSTHAGLRSRRRATCVGVRPSCSISEQTTRASSSAVIVRAGALTASSSRLCSAARDGASTTTGMVR
jgi:hypothetical protein